LAEAFELPPPPPELLELLDPQAAKTRAQSSTNPGTAIRSLT
jgi:hypothetical protein